MPSQVHRLFFALRPNAVVQEEIARATAGLKAMQHVPGRWLDPAKLHLTVQFFGDFISASEVVQGATSAAANLHIAPFDITLDRATSLPRRFKPPWVLCCAPDSEAPLQELSRKLGFALSAAGLGECIDARPYLPHLTLAYAENALPEPLAIEPIVWRVSEISLLDSHAGRHVQIDCWPLRSA